MPELSKSKQVVKRPELIVFKSFNEATSEAMPSLVAYDHAAQAYVIGGRAGDLARGGSSVVQDFKRFIGENDAFFEGRSTTTNGARAQRVWMKRPEQTGAIWLHSLLTSSILPSRKSMRLLPAILL